MPPFIAASGLVQPWFSAYIKPLSTAPGPVVAPKLKKLYIPMCPETVPVAELLGAPPVSTISCLILEAKWYGLTLYVFPALYIICENLLSV